MLKRRVWNSFNGSEKQLPAYERKSGLPIIYELRLRSNQIVRATLHGGQSSSFRRADGEREIVPLAEVTAWRWSKEDWRRIHPGVFVRLQQFFRRSVPE